MVEGKKNTDSAVCSLSPQEDACVLFTYSSCYLCFLASVRQNKRKVDPRKLIVSTSVGNRVSMNGRYHKRKVTEACY